MPMPVSTTEKRSVAWLASAQLLDHAQHDAALVRELDRVAHEVQQHLPQPERIADQAIGDVGGQVTGQPQSFLSGLRAKRPQHLADHLPHTESCRFQRDGARLEPREIQQLVQQLRHGAARFLQPFAGNRGRWA